MSSYRIAYEKLKHDYELAASTVETLNHFSPIKKVRVLSSIHGIPSITLTKMHGIALDGYTVDKTIYVNDEQNSTDDDVFLHDDHDHIAKHFHNDGLTILRCGLMTCVALEEAMRLMNIEQVKRVGFIGNGKTNIQNADCIHDLFGVTDMVIRGSARDRAKNRICVYMFGISFADAEVAEMLYRHEVETP